MAVMRIAYALRHAFEHERPAHVLALSTDENLDISPLVRAIAASLYDMGEDVLLAHPGGTGADQQTASGVPDQAPARTRLSSRRRNAVATREGGRTAAGAAPFTVERLDGAMREGSGDPFTVTDQEFLVIDGGSATSNPYLPTLLETADAILLVSSVGGTARSDLDRTLAILKPWEDRMIGNVALAA